MESIEKNCINNEIRSELIERGDRRGDGWATELIRKRKTLESLEEKVLKRVKGTAAGELRKLIQIQG